MCSKTRLCVAKPKLCVANCDAIPAELFPALDTIQHKTKSSKRERLETLKPNKNIVRRPNFRFSPTLSNHEIWYPQRIPRLAVTNIPFYEIECLPLHQGLGILAAVCYCL